MNCPLLIEEVEALDLRGNKMEKVHPRHDRLGWDDKHMLDALLCAQRSPDPDTQVGAIIVSQNNVILGSGYNSLPRGMDPSTINWARNNEDSFYTKYPFVVHAEKNAITNSTIDLKNSKLYTTLHPCNECAKDIIQAGIKEIIYLDDKYHDTMEAKAARFMFQLTGVKTRQHKWDQKNTISSLTKLVNIVNSKKLPYL